MKTPVQLDRISSKPTLRYLSSSQSAQQMELSRACEVTWLASSPASLMVLPPELRSLIFDHYFLSLKEKGATCPVGIDRRKLAQNHVHSFSGMYIAYPPLLHANKVIRHEAAKPFFTIMTFEMRFPRLPHSDGSPGYERLARRYTWMSGSTTHAPSLGSPHDQCCSFPSSNDRIREMLLSEPLSTPITASIRYAALDAEALCPRVFLILSQCCPALTSMTLDVGKWSNSKNDQVDIPRLTYYSSLLELGINYLPRLTYLCFQVSEWGWLATIPAIDLSRIHHFLQQRCQTLYELCCLSNNGRSSELFLEVVPVTVRPFVIDVCWATTDPNEESNSHQNVLLSLTWDSS